MLRASVLGNSSCARNLPAGAYQYYTAQSLGPQLSTRLKSTRQRHTRNTDRDKDTRTTGDSPVLRFSDRNMRSRKRDSPPREEKPLTQLAIW